MQLFTDSQKTQLFNSNKHVAGLTEIQVNDFSEFLEFFTVGMTAGLLGFGAIRIKNNGELCFNNEGLYKTEMDALTVEQAKLPAFLPDFMEGITQAEATKQLFECLDFNNQIELIKILRSGWNFSSDYEESTESMMFTADDDGSMFIVQFDDSTNTASIELNVA